MRLCIHVLICITSWFKLNDGNYVLHECRLRCLLECHKFNIIPTVMNTGRGWHRQWRKRVPTDDRPTKRSTMGRRFRRETFFFLFFSYEPIADSLRPTFKKFCANIRRSHCVGSILILKPQSRFGDILSLIPTNLSPERECGSKKVRSYLWPKVDPVFKLSNWRQLRKLHTFPHKSKCSRRL